MKSLSSQEHTHTMLVRLSFYLDTYHFQTKYYQVYAWACNSIVIVALLNHRQCIAILLIRLPGMKSTIKLNTLIEQSYFFSAELRVYHYIDH